MPGWARPPCSRRDALATDMRVLGSIGVESESEIPFASLHALFRPMLDLLPRIPTVQARALAAALALEEGEPDVLTVGAGTLSLLVEATAESPVLVAVDHAHWLDRASAEALAFAARRLIGEEFAMLATLRPDPGTPFDAFPRLELAPLAADAARRLLRQRSEPVAAADEAPLLAAAAGNPLALLELPVELARDLPTSVTSHDRLLRAFSRRVDDCPGRRNWGFCLRLRNPRSRQCGVQRQGSDCRSRSPLRRRPGLFESERAMSCSVTRWCAHSSTRTPPTTTESGAPGARRRAFRRAGSRPSRLASRCRRERRRRGGRGRSRGDRGAGRRAGGACRGGTCARACGWLSPERASVARRLYAASRAAY